VRPTYIDEVGGSGARLWGSLTRITTHRIVLGFWAWLFGLYVAKGVGRLERSLHSKSFIWHVYLLRTKRYKQLSAYCLPI